MSRAGISGMGVISALGNDLETTRKALFAPTEPLPHPPSRFATALELPVFELPEPAPAGDVPLPVRFLLHALDEALEEAKLTREMLRSMRVGIAIGTTVTCQLDNIPCHARIRKGDLSDLAAALTYVRGIPAEFLRRHLGTEGPVLTISNACASGSDALLAGLEFLSTGSCDLVIAGGCDTVNKVAFDGFNALRVCSGAPCRPFDAERSGLNLGDAAGVLILEDPDRAAARGVTVKYELSGAGKSADGFHITQPESSGKELERSIRLALEQAELVPGEIEFVNAHGTGTLVNDRTEGAVLARVFGEKLRYQSTKALTGHTLGAAGAIEAVFTCLMLEEGRAAASRRCSRPDPEVPVPPLAENAKISGHAALSTSLAFGGSNTSLVFRRCRPGKAGPAPKTLYIAGFAFLPSGVPDRKELVSLCTQYGLRRPDRLTQLVLAAVERLTPLTWAGETDTALVTVSSWGPSTTTEKVLDDILDYPEEEILPTGFSHSVINAAASCLGAAHHLHGPTFAITGFEDPFYEAAELAQALLSGNRCRRVLIVGADENSLTSRTIETLRRTGAPAVPEGGCALLLSSLPEENRLGTLELKRDLSDTPRLLSCGIPETLPGKLAAADPAARTALSRLRPPSWEVSRKESGNNSCKMTSKVRLSPKK